LSVVFQALTSPKCHPPENTDFSVRPTGRVFAKQIKPGNPETKVLGVTELKGRYVRNFVTIFGADELLDKKDLETKLIAPVTF